MRTVPEAITCFLEATSYEDTIRNAISLGGDADTIACIAGSIAEGRWVVPDDITQNTIGRLDVLLDSIVEEFAKKFML